MTNSTPYRSTTQFGMNAVRIAEICHEANRVYCKSLGDISQVRWADAPEWQKDSAVAGVNAIRENPSLSPDQVHSLWLQRKVKEGWVYGSVKDAEAKVHPCLKPWSLLPEDQRRKDLIFSTIVKACITPL